MSEDLWKIISVFLLSAIKFGLGGVPAAVFAKFSFFKSITITCAGGITGTIVFTYISDWIIKGYRKAKEKIRELKTEKKTKRKFTTTNRIIVKVKQKLGLIGIAIITPLILSIPLGCFIAVRYYENKQRVITYMSVSIIICATVLYLFYNYLYESVRTLFM